MKFKFDPRDFPDHLQSQEARDKFTDDVKDLLKDSTGGAPDATVHAAIVGMLVLDGATDTGASTFEDAFWDARGESAGKTLKRTGKDKVQLGQEPASTDYAKNKDVYQEAAQKISRFPGHSGDVYFQELAYVARKLLENTDDVPVDDPTFSSQIRVYDDEYVANGPHSAAGLSIPELTRADSSAQPDDIRAPNIQAVSVILAAYYLEQARLFETVDWIMETWWNGRLPTGADAKIKVLDDYFWNSENRLTQNARHMQYSRVLGVPGGEVSTEVQPNLGFMDGFSRFVANLAEYDRQQRIGNIVATQRGQALALTSELVRQSGRNVGAGASLYGWGGTQFAARRLADHIKKAFAILNIRDIQASYGVDGPWKVIERVAPEFGAAPNVVKWQAMATAGKTILDLVAKYASIWSGATGKPLFNDPASAGAEVAERVGDGFDALTQEVHVLTTLIAKATKLSTHGMASLAATSPPASTPAPHVGTADISDTDRDELMRQAGNYIAVLGIRGDAVSELSQPIESQYAPSIPNLMSGPAPSTNGQAGLDQLRAMVTQGQVPSLDQLKSLVLPTQ
jgi:hypothetical protein